jgi:hypothetical protein
LLVVALGLRAACAGRSSGPVSKSAPAHVELTCVQVRGEGQQLRIRSRLPLANLPPGRAQARSRRSRMTAFACSDRSGGTGGAQLTDVRIAHQSGFDRIKFQVAAGPGAACQGARLQANDAAVGCVQP